MSKIDTQKNRLRQESAAASHAAGQAETPEHRAALQKIAAEKAAAARRYGSAVRVLSERATAKEINTARQRQAVQIGKVVQLPTWSDACVGMPNIWLTSGFFSIADVEPVHCDWVPIPSRGDYSLFFKGDRLSSYDKKVLMTCLRLYRDVPLRTEFNRRAWLAVTYNDFLESMGYARSSMGGDARNTLYRALLRLSSASMRLRTGGVDMDVDRILHFCSLMSGDDDMADGTACPTSGLDKLFLSIPATMAEYFGPGRWSKLNFERQLTLDGLSLYLHDYVMSNSEGFWTSFSELKTMCGSAMDDKAFRKRVRKCFAALQAPELPGGPAINAPSFRKNLDTGEQEFWVTPRKPAPTVLQSPRTVPPAPTVEEEDI